MNKDLEFLTRVIDEKSAKILDANDKIWEYAVWRSMRQNRLPC